jgi:glycosyltransferase involved in cell wall biosynthesis
MVQISAVIITLNEERNIGRCLDSLMSVADDIVVVDSFSTDFTENICLERGVRFIKRKFTTYSEQKNFAVSQARYDHILSLDADEYLSAELLQSILVIKETWTTEAFRMNRLSSYAGKWVRHGSWYPNRQLRLWHRNFGKWNKSNPHEVVEVMPGTPVIQLKGNLMHRSYENATAALYKIELYSRLYAESNAGKKKVSVLGIFFHSGWAFFKSYFYKLGFLDGYAGLAVAKISSAHTFFKYARLYEVNGGMIAFTSHLKERKKKLEAEATVSEKGNWVP